jgi:predicted nucleic-acid-binding Zn-ribbon protein
MQDKYTGSLTPQEQAEVVRLHDEQYSGREIARSTGLTYGRVRGFLEWHLEEFSGDFPEPQIIKPPGKLDLAPPPKSPRILVYDIETAPAAAWVWSAYKTNIIAMKQDWYLLSFAYKWFGQKGTHFVSINQDPEFTPGTTNDLYVAERLASLLDAADVVIAHNGNNFDQKKGNSRFLFHGFDPPAPYQQIDTLRESKRYFNNYQHSLKELGRLYTSEEKMVHHGFELWLGCMAGDPESWAIMEKYNRQDVLVLERLYLRLRPWIGSPGRLSHPNMGHYKKGLVCPKCGSEDVQRRGFHRTTVSEFQTIQCKTCRGYSRLRNRKSQEYDEKVEAL